MDRLIGDPSARWVDHEGKQDRGDPIDDAG